MTQAALPFWMRFVPDVSLAPEHHTRTDPPQPVPGQPVFLNDVATPFAGSTLLAYYLQQDAARTDPDCGDTR